MKYYKTPGNRSKMSSRVKSGMQDAKEVAFTTISKPQKSAHKNKKCKLEFHRKKHIDNYEDRM